MGEQETKLTPEQIAKALGASEYMPVSNLAEATALYFSRRGRVTAPEEIVESSPRGNFLGRPLPKPDRAPRIDNRHPKPE